MNKPNIDNYATEVLDTICEQFKDDKQLVIEILRYLYYTSKDERIRSQIVSILTDMNYCISCGSEMVYYEWKEPRPLGEETMSAYICPSCDKE